MYPSVPTSIVGATKRCHPLEIAIAAAVVGPPTFAGAKIFGFTVEEAILASNANIGGPTTAAAMAISKGWHRFVAPTMLVGTLGYIIGTYVGIFIGQILN